MTARLVSRRDLDQVAEWKSAFADFCKDRRYYEIVEDTLRDGFEHHYLVFANGAVQPIFFVQQNIIEGVTGPLRSIVDLVRKTFPRFLTMRALMVGNAAGEGRLGGDVSAENLATALSEIARDQKASLIVFKDFPAQYRSTLDGLATHGYARVPSMPLTKLELDFRDFEDFLGALSKITRKGLRRKFRKAEAAAKIDMEVVTDIAPFVDEIHPLYLAVHERSPMKFETLTKEYFVALSRDMPERVRYFLWRQNGKIIAFEMALICGDTIYDECLGMDYRVALELSLYFYTLRDVLAWAIANGLKHYVSTPLNYDPKLHLGCTLAPLDLYVRHTMSILNPIFRRAVKFLEPTRHDPVLRQFPNAHEL
ncbi:MAG: hypothetical protein QOG48_2331 [Verrucomicrobiota bacterium]|jgi:hypothetical protein